MQDILVLIYSLTYLMYGKYCVLKKKKADLPIIKLTAKQMQKHFLHYDAKLQIGKIKKYKKTLKSPQILFLAGTHYLSLS